MIVARRLEVNRARAPAPAAALARWVQGGVVHVCVYIDGTLYYIFTIDRGPCTLKGF